MGSKEERRISLAVYHPEGLPFFRKWTRVPENYDELYQQMLDEMKQPDFEGRWTFLTAWGINQAKDKHGLSRRK